MKRRIPSSASMAYFPLSMAVIMFFLLGADASIELPHHSVSIPLAGSADEVAGTMSALGPNRDIQTRPSIVRFTGDSRHLLPDAVGLKGARSCRSRLARDFRVAGLLDDSFNGLKR